MDTRHQTYHAYLAVLCILLTYGCSSKVENRYPGFTYAGAEYYSTQINEGGKFTNVSTKLDVFFKQNNEYIDEIIIDARDMLSGGWYWNCAPTAPEPQSLYINNTNVSNQKVISLLNATGSKLYPSYSGIKERLFCRAGEIRTTNKLSYYEEHSGHINKTRDNINSEIFLISIDKNALFHSYSNTNIRISDNFSYNKDWFFWSSYEVETETGKKNVYEETHVFLNKLAANFSAIAFTIAVIDGNWVDFVKRPRVIQSQSLEIFGQTYEKRTRLLPDDLYILKTIQRTTGKNDPVICEEYKRVLVNDPSTSITIGYYEFINRPHAELIANDGSAQYSDILQKLDYRTGSAFEIQH